MRAIFISYRREDAEGQAGRLFDDLVKDFGDDSVFMDVAGLEPGRDFRRAIDEQVASCGVLLAVIGKGWLEAKDESGQRRLDDPMDFVRLETASALKRDIPVIPVLVRGASMPRAEDLPEDLKELAFRNGVELTHARWDSDVQVLVKALRPYVQVKPEPAGLRPPSAPSEPGPTKRGSSRMIIVAVLVSVLVLAFVGYLWYRKSSEEAARQALVLAEEKRLAVANDEKAKAEANRINKEKTATDQADTRKKPEAKMQAQDVPPFRDWDGFWNFSSVWEGNKSIGEMELRSDRLGITGEYRDGAKKLLGTLKGTFVGGDFSKVTGEFTNPVGSGGNCPSGEQAGKRGGSFSLDLAKGGKSWTGWWDLCTVGKRFPWDAEKLGGISQQ
jgi:hypothetical protein